jgi:hypothetical protein
MASDLTVQTIRGPGSGANANKVIVPTGQTLTLVDKLAYDNLPIGSVLQVVTMKATTLATQNTTTFSEPSSSYRLSITPKYNNSRIHLTYGFNCNVQGTLSVIYHFRAVRNPASGGTLLTSDGGTFDGNLGNRTNMNMAHRGPVSDLNDSFFMYFQAWDEPATTSQVQYGLHGRRETGGAGAISYNHTVNNEGSYGWMVPFVITATEIKQ